ncbi:hypothetical protein NIES4103_16770 [Nostoc sp. NIES-4103]|nr:hypothetical protein NIES4103_16770 [Nostoc sp. NIES-4103]
MTLTLFSQKLYFVYKFLEKNVGVYILPGRIATGYGGPGTPGRI